MRSKQSGSSSSRSSARTSSSARAGRCRRSAERTWRRHVDAPAQKIGVLLRYRGDDADAARRVAMHVASEAPQWLSREQAPVDAVTAERGEIFLNSDQVQSKPEQAREKIVEGMLSKRFFAAKGGALLDQAFIHDTGKNVGQALAEAGIEVVDFVRASVTEQARCGCQPRGERGGRFVARRGGSGIFPRPAEALGRGAPGPKEYGIDLPTVERIAAEIAEVNAAGVEIAVVVGAGNIYRGMAAAAEGMDRATADYVGMLSTLHNALALDDRLEGLGVPTRLLSALTVSEVAEPRTAGGRSGTSRRSAS